MNRWYKMLKSCKGFTLIEILIVVVIIGILAALILPVYQSAQIKAKRASCINNIKQIGEALQLYARDWEGLMSFRASTRNP